MDSTLLQILRALFQAIQELDTLRARNAELEAVLAMQSPKEETPCN